VQGISKGAKRLQDVVDAMLDVSLIETEAFAVHPISISLKHMIDQVLEGLEDAIRERHQVVTRDGLDALPDILADGMRLHQAFRNLIVNSIKFTPDGGRIDIRARMVEDGKCVEVAIADTGIGIDAQHQDLIFEKFYRVGDLNLHSTGQTKFKGAGPGLGLPIARGIVEAHGGKIWVESGGHNEETFPGSTFYVCLPVDGPTAQQGRVTL
jgi:signal transduction histidine kinase